MCRQMQSCFSTVRTLLTTLPNTRAKQIMSHNATNWAIKQRGLKPATKIVLWHLCDRHNPDFGCFPSQKTLSIDCEMSERSVRNQLDLLEECGLVRRIKRKGTGGTYLSDRYMLGFEDGFTQRPAAKSADGKNASKPAAKTGKNQRQILPPNPVREPVIEPCADAHTKPEYFDSFWEVHPRPRDEEESSEIYARAVADGVSPEWINRSAKQYADEHKGNSKQYVQYSDNWLVDGRWRDFPETPPPDPKDNFDKVASLAKSIKNGRYVSMHSLTESVTDEMLTRKLVTSTQLREIGVLT